MYFDISHPDNQETIATVRRTLVQQGYRLFAYDFDGSGDEGGLNDVRVAGPEYCNTALDEYPHSLDEFEDHGKKYDYVTQSYVDHSSAHYKAALEAIKSCAHGEEVIEHMFYKALENFPGDWVNNEGGYGIVAIDLLTGDYRIDGFQRISDTEDADASGTAFAALDDITLSPLDLSSVIKNTLTS